MNRDKCHFGKRIKVKGTNNTGTIREVLDICVLIAFDDPYLNPLEDGLHPMDPKDLEEV